jgi:sensor histidine kinase YesM
VGGFSAGAEIFSWSQENELKGLRLMQYLWLIGGLAALAIIVVLFAFILRRQQILKNSRQTLMLQQRLLRSQINPHFIFNSLSSIQNAIINQEPEKASKYLTRFSKLIRNILDSSVEESVTLEDEISNIENYLALQKIRFPDKFDYTITVDEKLDTDRIIIPPMLAQPFIENAIEHGIKHKETKGHVHIRFMRQDKLMLFEIEDDGVGRQKARKIQMDQNRDHKSLATNITLERINVLNKKFKKKITLDIIDLGVEDGEPKGTRVVFGVPV